MKVIILIFYYINTFNNVLTLPNKPKIALKEGVKGYKEAITFLDSMNEMPSLRINFGLIMFAQYELGKRIKSEIDLTISNEKFKKYGSYDKIQEIAFYDTNLNYTDNYDEIIIINLLVCDGDSKRKFRNVIFSNEYNEIGISVDLFDNDTKIFFEVITAKNFVSKCKIKDGVITEIQNMNQTFIEKKQKMIDEAEKEIDDRVKKSDLYIQQNYNEIKEERHVLYNENNNILSVIKMYTFLYENGNESEISISKAVKCESS